MPSSAPELGSPCELFYSINAWAGTVQGIRERAGSWADHTPFLLSFPPTHYFSVAASMAGIANSDIFRKGVDIFPGSGGYHLVPHLLSALHSTEALSPFDEFSNLADTSFFPSSSHPQSFSKCQFSAILYLPSIYLLSTCHLCIISFLSSIYHVSITTYLSSI